MLAFSRRKSTSRQFLRILGQRHVVSPFFGWAGSVISGSYKTHFTTGRIDAQTHPELSITLTFKLNASQLNLLNYLSIITPLIQTIYYISLSPPTKLLPLITSHHEVFRINYLPRDPRSQRRILLLL